MILLDKIGVLQNSILSKPTRPPTARLRRMSEPSAVTLSPAARELLPELKEHLGAYGVLVHQYCKHFALSSPRSGAIHRALETHSLQTFRHLRQIAVCMNRLGGVPVGSMLELVDQAYLEPEAEGLRPWHEMLAHDQRLERENNLRLALTVNTAVELKARQIARSLASLQAAGFERIARLEVIVHDLEVN